MAAVYEESRPGYPQQAVDWLVPSDAVRVADIGAGTGKFTRLLERPGREVIAVDPSPHMLDELRRALPMTDARPGSAEHLPLEEASIDAVTFAQSWHWVDASAGPAEVGRVLRPGGMLGLIWNLRDERVDWMRQLGVAMHADGDQYTDEVGTPQVGAPFGEPEAAQFPWASTLTRDGVLDLVRSRSYFALMTEAEQDATLAAVSTVLATHPQTAGRETFEFPYVTVCFRYRRL